MERRPRARRGDESELYGHALHDKHHDAGLGGRDGVAVAEAAETLGISLPTAKTHLARLFDKTGTSRQADLVRLAMSALAPTSAGS